VSPILEIFFYILGFVVLLVICQDVLLFPALVNSSLRKVFCLLRICSSLDLPSGVESIFVTTDDGKRLELWRLPGDPYEEKRDFVALVFHGNGGSLESFIALQLWFSYLGITSYGIDYRGFGRSSGWPSEEGLTADSDAFWRYVSEREGLSASRTIVLGYSVGGPMAARLASKISANTLLLISTFSDLRSVVKSKRILGYLSRFLWYRLATYESVAELKSTNLILAHGGQDTVVDVSHLDVLANSYRGSGSLRKVLAEGSGHNDTFFTIRADLADNLVKVIEAAESTE
jgi:hypothetical protein